MDADSCARMTFLPGGSPLNLPAGLLVPYGTTPIAATVTVHTWARP
jgi:hypothetical protein